MIPRNRRIINLQAIEENMRLLRSVTPSTAKMMAVVKADGYGHGAAETAEAAIRGGADMLAVASVGKTKGKRDPCSDSGTWSSNGNRCCGRSREQSYTNRLLTGYGQMV